jgi:polyferredoxin
MSALLHQFTWEVFLVDPLIFILWGFVALTLLLWGRGVYCGWLCPFGALQELIFKIARRFRIPEFDIPDVIHERLTALKYVIFVALFGISLQSIGYAGKAAEVEPFKTVIVMHFNREGIFLAYALALLVIGVFNRKFYCKYLCPLGAALAIPAPLRIFDWLRRRKECGRPCQICARKCEVQAIRPTGEINPNECHYCLDCQVTYWDDHDCPPLSEKRIRREKSKAALDRIRAAEPPVKSPPPEK